MFFGKKKHHHNGDRREARTVQPVMINEDDLFNSGMVAFPMNDSRSPMMNNQPLRHEVDSFPDGRYVGGEEPPYIRKPEAPPSYGFDEVSAMASGNDRYIEPAILELREATEADLPDDLRNLGTYMRSANAAVAERLAADMAQTYRAHLATIMELNTQMNLQAAMDNRINLTTALNDYLSNRDF